MEIWILLADTRKKLLWAWLIFTAVFIGLVLFMTLTNRFEDIEGAAWLWALSSVLPMLAMLYGGVVMNPQPSKVIKKAYFQVIFYGAIAYLLLVLMTLFGLPMWLNNHPEGSVLDYFKQSYLWLIPFQIVLLVATWILYFQKTKLDRPNKKILLEYAQKKADYANRFGSLAQKRGFGSLLENDYPSVFESLEKNLTDKDDRNTALILSGQYTDLTEQRNLDTIEPAEAQRELNRITLVLVELIEKM
jgi:Effector-associated domain 11